LATSRQRTYRGLKIVITGGNGKASACFDWLHAEIDSRRSRVHLEWSTSDADHVLIHGRAFRPHGRAAVRVASGGRVSLTACAAAPGGPGETRHIYLVPRLDAQWPEAPLPLPQANERLFAGQRRSRRRAAGAIRSIMRARAAPMGQRSGPGAPRFMVAIHAETALLSAGDRQAAAREGGQVP
jgi:hypothetical protein